MPTATQFPLQQQRRWRRRPKCVQKARMKHRRKAEHAESELEFEPVDIEQGSELYKRWLPPHLFIVSKLTTLPRFFSLPVELRNHVYRLLLVQPCKFDMHHNEGCTRLVRDNRPGPRFENHPEADLRLYRCAECSPTFSWRASNLPGFVSPARSRWGHTLPNEFMCDRCWGDKFGNIYRPSTNTLPCLCTRRQNLDILLVNKRINREASYVFWTENHFAFENSSLLEGFLSNIRRQVRQQITRISLMAHSLFEARAIGAPDEEVSLPPPTQLERLWEELGDCTGLVDLELDSHYLSHKYYVLGMRRLKVKRSVTFFCHPLAQEVGMEHRGAAQPGIRQLIWPALAFRQPVEDSTRYRSATRKLACELADSIVRGRQLKIRYLKDLYRKSLETRSQ
ncbi:hypothetical protein PISL3812_06322 [Talaromyces islandicus]|uniref:Uncharacterized protein n=1 Tax=Talaromyces islandicus TaxID=28573 RepID=A0A0U1M2I6_TALIS|nr:hypothetical protein PISL3812_06322 [Talaromyces islandicus]